MMKRCSSAPSFGPHTTAPCKESLFPLFVSTLCFHSRSFQRHTTRSFLCISCSAAPTIGEEMHDSTRHGASRRPPPCGLSAPSSHASVLLRDVFTISASLWEFGGELEGPRGGMSLSISLSRDVMLLRDAMLLRDRRRAPACGTCARASPCLCGARRPPGHRAPLGLGPARRRA